MTGGCSVRLFGARWRGSSHASVMCGVAWRRRFVVFTVLTVAGPVSWLGLQPALLSRCAGLYARALLGWGDREEDDSRRVRGTIAGGITLCWALILYMRTAQLDAAAWEIGFAGDGCGDLAGSVLAIRRGFRQVVILFWLPLPFYVYSVAYGSVPIFIPQLWPHSVLQLAVWDGVAAGACGVSVFAAWRGWSSGGGDSQPLKSRLMHPIALALIAANTIAMMYRVPLVLKEAQVNSTTRVAFETALARSSRAFQREFRF